MSYIMEAALVDYVNAQRKEAEEYSKQPGCWMGKFPCPTGQSVYLLVLFANSIAPRWSRMHTTSRPKRPASLMLGHWTLPIGLMQICSVTSIGCAKERHHNVEVYV